MGGEGSGRKPDVAKALIEEIRQPIGDTGNESLFLPNYSGVKSEALKTSTSGIAGVGGNDQEIQYNDNGTFGGTADLFWDKSSNRLGKGTQVPLTDIHIKKEIPRMRIDVDHETNAGFLDFCRQGTEKVHIAISGDAADSLNFLTNGQNRVRIKQSGEIIVDDMTALRFVFTDAEKILTNTAPSNVVNHVLPTQSGHSGEFLTTNGTNVSWGASSGSSPTGSILMWGTGTAPTGYLLCDGAAVSRSTYAALFAVISTTFGVGNGTTTFNVPNTQDLFVLGAGNGFAVNEQGGTINHTHTFTTATGYDQLHTSGTEFVLVGSDYAINTIGHTHTGTTDENGVYPPYIALYHIIKT